MLNRHRKLRIEQMEARQMMAGDITASLQGGSLFLTEATGQAGLDNSVRVSKLDNGKIRIEGNSTLTDGTVSKVNGKTFQDFDVTGALNVNFGGGSDLVLFTPTNQLSFTEIHIDVAAPAPTATRSTTFTTSPITFLRPDNDNVLISRFQTTGAVTINTGDGDDWVHMQDFVIGQIGGPLANVSINTGAGADIVELKSAVEVAEITGTLDIQTFKSLSETNADTVWLEKVQVLDSFHARTGGGNDLIHLDGLFVNHNLDFDAGAGNDTASIKSVVAVDSIMAHLGEGDDTLSTEALFTNNLQLFGDGGFDKLYKNADTHVTTRTETGWETINGIPAFLVNGSYTLA